MPELPDSDATPAEGFSVFDTPGRDHPEFGSVQVRMDLNQYQSNTWRMTRDDAYLLRGALDDYLTSKERN